MWRSRTIPDPRGGDQPACETVLLHREDFKIPENMARFAVKHGMAGFVKKLGPEVKAFVAQRRQRCQPVSCCNIMPLELFARGSFVGHKKSKAFPLLVQVHGPQQCQTSR